MNHLPQIINVNSRRIRRGFTLVETIIAMGIITIMITAFLAAFGPAVQGIRKSISAKEANRLASSLEYEMSVLRDGEPGGINPTPFSKAAKWIRDSVSTDRKNFVLIYQYRGDPGNVRRDGTLEPFAGTSGVSGKDYVLQSVVRRFDARVEGVNVVEEELQPGVVEGRVFYVRMKQLIFENGVLTVTDKPGKIIDPMEPHTASPYPEAVIAYQAEFYVLKSSIYSYVKTGFKTDGVTADDPPTAAGKPVFTRNMAVRR